MEDGRKRYYFLLGCSERERAIDSWKGFERWIKQTSGMGKGAHQMKKEHRKRGKNRSRGRTQKHNK